MNGWAMLIGGVLLLLVSALTEDWGAATLNYQGSLVSFYYSRQAIGTYKGISYNPPNRVYAFDGNFTQGPQWLPPRTPTLRTVNTTGFSQMLSPTQ